ncbi:MarR family winged helix-turn-helix transcriptional regulator [Streptomyces diastatochromogenes]|uniref:MarR family winged helix-turn-helix transcriptional regulator n=1 Tax=Streptomyces diastatochromogenes TaxID=42236 RepID=UPI00369B7DD6
METTSGKAAGDIPSAAQHARVSHAIFRVGRLHRMFAGRLLSELGLHPGQAVVMRNLWERGALRQVDLGELVGSDAATMTRTVRRLERAGLVRRVPSPTDKRSVIVEPTAASLALRRKVRPPAAIWNTGSPTASARRRRPSCSPYWNGSSATWSTRWGTPPTWSVAGIPATDRQRARTGRLRQGRAPCHSRAMITAAAS